MKLIWKYTKRAAKYLALLLVVSLIYARFFPIPFTLYMLEEKARLGNVKYEWIALDEMPDYVASSVIASEDSGFCAHGGVEWQILFEVIKDGANRGASTITQQMVKNLWLWQGESTFSRKLRKGVEIPLSVLVDLVYSKERIMEIYLNIVEFDTGVFGIEAASLHHFGKPASELSRREAALMAAVLPSPKTYQAVPPSDYISRRAKRIAAMALDVEKMGLASCL